MTKFFLLSPNDISVLYASVTFVHLQSDFFFQVTKMISNQFFQAYTCTPHHVHITFMSVLEDAVMEMYEIVYKREISDGVLMKFRLSLSGRLMKTTGGKCLSSTPY